MAKRVIVKARNPFLGTKKKMGSTLNFETEKPKMVAIVEGCSRTIQKKSFFQKGKRKGVKIPSLTLAAPQRSKWESQDCLALQNSE